MQLLSGPILRIPLDSQRACLCLQVCLKMTLKLRMISASAPVSLGVAIIPCNFTGTITVTGDGFNQVFTISEPVALQAGYIKRITLDLDKSTHSSKGFPQRLGIIGDSISTFQGMIPSNHKAYYTNPAGSGCDVTTWQQTYWGLLISQYWNCELDMNTSWSSVCLHHRYAYYRRICYICRKNCESLWLPMRRFS